MKIQRPDVDLFVMGLSHPAAAAAPRGPGRSPDGSAKRKVKVNSVLDQADEAEVPERETQRRAGETGDQAFARPSLCA